MVEGAGRCRAVAKVGDTVVATAELMLGYDTGQGHVIPAEARAGLAAWAETVNRNLLSGLAVPPPEAANS